MNEGICGCEICKYDIDFELPQELIEIAHRGDLVIFAGAGISTEVKEVYPISIYERIKEELSIEDSEISFPELMESYQELHGRKNLVKTIIEKFEYINSFKSLRDQASRFHQVLATMPYINTVITTNWDLYFENYAGFKPFTTSEDMLFWDEFNDRKLLKVHGSVNNLGSLIATQADYEETLLKRSLMFNKMQEILANKTVVFIGYSLSDWNFQSAYKETLESLNKFAPQAYLVSPFENSNSDHFNLKFIQTSGQNFLTKLKHSLTGHCFSNESIYEMVDGIYNTATRSDLRNDRLSSEFRLEKNPEIIFQWFYNDGMIDACNRIYYFKTSGKYNNRNHVKSLIDNYSRLIKSTIRNNDYSATAYFSGYENVLYSILDLSGDWNIQILTETAEKEGVPLEDLLLSISTKYFFATQDAQFKELEEYKEFLGSGDRELLNYRKIAGEIVQQKNLTEDMVLNFRPFLPAYYNEVEK